MQLIASPTHDARIDASATMYPSSMVALRDGHELSSLTSSYYGYVVEGSANIQTPSLELVGQAGTFFALPGTARLQVQGLSVVIERVGYRCFPLVGTIEERGRLAYIDGCSDTVLAAPPRLGDPVLNLLHFPAGIRQSVHSHPSIRMGVVARGAGVAFGPGNGAGWRLELEPGAMFMIPAHEMHAFSTAESGSSLDIVAYHPDSDWGPTDGTHPMLNRTYLR